MASEIEILPSHHRKKTGDVELKSVDLESANKDLAGHLLGLEVELEKAINRAIQKLGAWLRTHSVREISKELNIKQMVIKRRYRFSKIGGKNGQPMQLKIWVGLLAIAAHEAGAVTHNRNSAGAKVRGRQFDSAFKARIYGSEEKMYIRAAANRRHGHTTVTEGGRDWSGRRRPKHLKGEGIRRAKFEAEQGSSRFPVQVIGIDISEIGLDVLQRYESRLNSRYRELLDQELNYALNVET